MRLDEDKVCGACLPRRQQWEPWSGPASESPHPPVPAACTCNPDCSGLEVRLSLEELTGGAAQAGEIGGAEGVSRVLARLSLERWVGAAAGQV